MRAKGKFILLDVEEFQEWIVMQHISRKIKLIQQHHTYIPSYQHFNSINHFELCTSMQKAHIERGFDEIGQNFTIFPDGKIMVCRSIDKIPAGIKGANSYGICIENIGNFDKNKDVMNQEHHNSILTITTILLKNFNLIPSDQTIVYHHWYDLITGKRIEVEGAGITKTCPGETFFGGNTINDFKREFLPQLNEFYQKNSTTQTVENVRNII